MKLKEYMKTAPDGEYFLGGKKSNAFFWIGTQKQYTEEISSLSEEMHRALTDAVARCEDDIKKTQARLIALEKQLKKKKRAVEKWIPLKEREVVETYDKTAPGEEGTAVLISGSTGGVYWFKDEYEKVRKGKINA